MILGLLALVSSAACAPPVYHADAELEPLVLEFVAESKGLIKKIDNLTIEFGSMEEIRKEHKDPRIIGYCSFEDDGPYVRIEKEWYSNATPLLRKSLIYHELGHCILDEDHREGKQPEDDDCPVSIMNPTVVGMNCLREHYDYYIDELFHGNTNGKYKRLIRKLHPKRS